MGMIPTLIIYVSMRPRMVNSRVGMGLIPGSVWLLCQARRELEAQGILVVLALLSTRVALPTPPQSPPNATEIHHPLLLKERKVIRVLNLLRLTRVMLVIALMVSTR